jgi:hypothetical protein
VVASISAPGTTRHRHRAASRNGRLKMKLKMGWAKVGFGWEGRGGEMGQNGLVRFRHPFFNLFFYFVFKLVGKFDNYLMNQTSKYL